MIAATSLGAVVVATLYRWRDASGVDHLEGSLAEVPPAYRDSAVPVETGLPVESRPALRGAAEDLGIQAQRVENAANAAVLAVEKALFGKASGSRLHLPSIVLGVGVVVVLLVGLSALRRRPGRTVKLLLAFVAAGALGAGYLGYMRSSARFAPAGSGLPTTILTSPAAIVDDAHKAAEAMSKAAAEQQRKLDEIDRSSRNP